MFSLFVLGQGLSCNPGWPPTCYVAMDDLELVILLSPFLKCLDYRLELPRLGYVVLGMENVGA